MASNQIRKTFLFIFLIFCITVCYAHAQIKCDAAKFMPLSEVKPGMKGKGYTVFSGTTVATVAEGVHASR